MKKNFSLTGIRGALVYGTVAAIAWLGASSAIVCALIFLFAAFNEGGLLGMFFVGFSLILQGQYWMQRDIQKLLDRGES